MSRNYACLSVWCAMPSTTMSAGRGGFCPVPRGPAPWRGSGRSRGPFLLQNWTRCRAYATRADNSSFRRDSPHFAGDGRYSGGKPLTRIPIDPDTIRALAAVLVETGLTEIEIADKDSRIRVVRGGGVATTVVPVAAATPTPAASAVAAVVQDVAAHPGAVVS